MKMGKNENFQNLCLNPEVAPPPLMIAVRIGVAVTEATTSFGAICLLCSPFLPHPLSVWLCTLHRGSSLSHIKKESHRWALRNASVDFTLLLLIWIASQNFYSNLLHVSQAYLLNFSILGPLHGRFCLLPFQENSNSEGRHCESTSYSASAFFLFDSAFHLICGYFLYWVWFSLLSGRWKRFFFLGGGVVVGFSYFIQWVSVFLA